MIYIAKMHTRYPEFHGEGYYNFLMAYSQERLDTMVENNSHDYSLEGTVVSRFKTIENLTAKYKTKQELNERYFNGK